MSLLALEDHSRAAAGHFVSANIVGSCKIHTVRFLCCSGAQPTREAGRKQPVGGLSASPRGSGLPIVERPFAYFANKMRLHSKLAL